MVIDVPIVSFIASAVSIEMAMAFFALVNAIVFIRNSREDPFLCRKGLTYRVCSAQLTGLKQELMWLSEVDSTALQSALKHLADAYEQFFRKLNNAPCFKSKKNPVQSYTTQIQGKSQILSYFGE